MTKTKKKMQLIPDARLLLNSLRSVGYTPKTALADIIDNSVSAQAKEIEIDFRWDDVNSCISVKDDGGGMPQKDLIMAMRIGSRDPSICYEEDDLGRFGMGMKTAAFSLGKKITVVSKADEEWSDACWDLDYIDQSEGRWDLIINNDDNVFVQKAKAELADCQTGTIVIVEKLDSLIDYSNITKSKKNFYNLISEIEHHLSLVFHRFIEDDSLLIRINNNVIRAWNPFVLDNNATQELAEEAYFDEETGQTTLIQPYVLPHKSKFSDVEKHKQAEGIYGWTAHQGVYVYRNRRLLVFGTWFGVIKKEPAFNLARIKLDISAAHDFDWKIDIKKSKATPPIYIRDLLEQVIVRCSEASSNVYNSRGTYSIGPAMPNLSCVWEQRKNAMGRYSFFLNKKHLLLKNLKQAIGVNHVAELNAYLALVENYSPVLQSGIVEYMREQKDVDKIDDLEKQQDILSLKTYIHSFKKSGFSGEEIKSTLLEMKNYSYLKKEIIALLEEQKND